MKRLLFALCCVAMLAACAEEDKSTVAKAPERYGWEEDIPLFGDVECVTVREYDADIKFGEVVTELQSTYTYRLNAAGDVVEYVANYGDDSDHEDESVKYEYNSAGKIIREVETETYNDYDYYSDDYDYTSEETVTVYKYNAEGLCSQRIYTYSNGDTYKITYKYDNKGREIEKREYDRYGDLEDVRKKKYDAKGNLTEENWYDEDGDLWDKRVNTYDKRGNLIEIIDYNSDGSEGSRTTCKYDKAGNCIERIYDSEDWKTKSTYKYNAQGLVVAEKLYSDDALYFEGYNKYNAAGGIIEVKRISHYDDDNSVEIVRTTLDKHNNIVRMEHIDDDRVVEIVEIDITYR